MDGRKKEGKGIKNCKKENKKKPYEKLNREESRKQKRVQRRKTMKYPAMSEGLLREKGKQIIIKREILVTEKGNKD